MAMDLSAWQGVFGALGGVALTSLVGLRTAKLTNQWQLQREQRARDDSKRQARAEVRRAAYAELLAKQRSFPDQLDEWIDRQPPDLSGDEVRSRMYEALGKEFADYDSLEAHARLLAGEEVVQELDAYRRWLSGAIFSRVQGNVNALAETEERDAPLIQSMREELRLDFGLDLEDVD